MRPAAKRRRPGAELLDRRVEAHEAAAQPRRDAAGDERHRRTEAPGHEDEEHDARPRPPPASGSGGRCVITTIGTSETNARIVNTRFLP